MKIKAKGTLRYVGEKTDLQKENGRAWMVLDVDPNLGWLYHRLIPKYKNANAQRWPSHITILRGFGIERVPNPEPWMKYAGESIEYEYDNDIQFKHPYFYLMADSERLQEIRVELGLPPHREGFLDFHITVANVKKL